MAPDQSVLSEGVASARRAEVSSARLALLEQANRCLEQEVVQHRKAAELARGQSEMLIQSLNFLAAESNLDKFLGHVLIVTVQQLRGTGGTLWFPDPVTGKPHVDVPSAGHIIDLLAMLQQKTVNNLDAEESGLLDRVLYELRMRYIEVSQNPPAAKDEERRIITPDEPRIIVP